MNQGISRALPVFNRGQCGEHAFEDAMRKTEATLANVDRGGELAIVRCAA